MGIEVGTPTYILLYLTTSPDAATPGLGMDATVVGQIVAVYWLLMLVGRFCRRSYCRQNLQPHHDYCRIDS